MNFLKNKIITNSLFDIENNSLVQLYSRFMFIVVLVHLMIFIGRTFKTIQVFTNISLEKTTLEHKEMLQRLEASPQISRDYLTRK